MLQSQWQYIPRQHMVKKTFYVGSQSDTQLCTMQNWHIPIVKHIFIFWCCWYLERLAYVAQTTSGYATIITKMAVIDRLEKSFTTNKSHWATSTLTDMGLHLKQHVIHIYQKYEKT